MDNMINIQTSAYSKNRRRMSTLPGHNGIVRLTDKRKDGNTTRQIDLAINLLFQGYEIWVRDHYEDGNNRIQNERLMELIMIRLRREHPHIVNKINIRMRDLTLFLSEEDESYYHLNNDEEIIISNDNKFYPLLLNAK